MTAAETQLHTRRWPYRRFVTWPGDVLVIPAGSVLRVLRHGPDLLLWPPQNLPVIGPRWGKLAALRPDPDLLDLLEAGV